MDINSNGVNINNVQNEDIKSAENMKENKTKQTGGENSALLSVCPLSAELIANITGGFVIPVNGGFGGESKVFTKDSREVSEGCIFVAIRGEKYDAHNFIAQAVAGGARIIIAERCPAADTLPCGADIVIVADTVSAMGALAAYFIKKSGVKTIAVTGSVGKTTTKELIATVLSERYKTHKTEGNKNNEIGLPLMALSIPSDAEYGVFEVGMSAPGEIGALSRIVKPSISVITNIGTSHMERLGSRENIAKAKLEVLWGMSEGGILIINADEPLLTHADVTPAKAVTVSLYSRSADYRAVNIRQIGSSMVFDLIYNDKVCTNVEIPILGTHNVSDALYAFAIGIIEGMTEEEIRRGLKKFRGVSMRQRIYDLAGITIIEDCYNASPESMRAGIDVLCSMAKEKGGRPAALLGDMRELGEYSRLLHEQLGIYAARAGVKLLFTYGPLAENIAHSAITNGIRAENVYVNLDYTDPASTGEMILSALRPGDVLLVKASRAVAAEKVIEYIKGRKFAGV